MADFAALPLFTDAFIADTTHLSAEETGAYMMLLMCAWRTHDCGLPDDDRTLQRFSRVTANRWPKVREKVLSFWTLEDGRWFQKRLVKERDFVSRKCQSQSRNAKSRWLKTKETTDATAMPNACQTDAPTPTPTPIYTEGDKSPSGAYAPEGPEDLFYGVDEEPRSRLSGKEAEARCFALGREVFGNGSGGMVTKINRRCSEGWPETLKIMEIGLTKHDPRTWLAKVANGKGSARLDYVLEETTAMYEAWGVC